MAQGRGKREDVMAKIEKKAKRRARVEKPRLPVYVPPAEPVPTPAPEPDRAIAPPEPEREAEPTPEPEPAPTPEPEPAPAVPEHIPNRFMG